jgi:diacylglycerol O-acyltransferase / wax synthase
LARAAVSDVIPRVTNHITTARVPGPASSRWSGDVEVVDWISFSLAVAPADVNLTAYSYDGRLTIGLVVRPSRCPTRGRSCARWSSP